MEPIFQLSSTTLQSSSRRFNFTCIDCTWSIIALGTDIGSCHLYSTTTLMPFGQIIYLPNLPHLNQSDSAAQSHITSCKFSLICDSSNFILLLIGTASGHIHLYNVDIVNCTSFVVQSIKIDCDPIESVLWCKLHKLIINDYIDTVIISIKSGKIYLLYLSHDESPVKIINSQLIYQCKNDEIIQTSFKKHFVLISCLTRCFILDFSLIYDKKENETMSLAFVNDISSTDSDLCFINIYFIGSRPRHGYYGACFDSLSIDECDQILSARKSGRIWIGETQSGSVKNTLRFKLPKVANIFDGNNSFCTSDMADIKDINDIKNINLGILIPFGNWTLSYVHPQFDLNIQRLNNFGLKILDHNLPKLIQWYPNLGRIIDCAVQEEQCCLYIVYDALNTKSIHLGRIQLCSPNESVNAKIGDNKLNEAIDYLCAYKVRDINTLKAIQKIIKDADENHINKFKVHLEHTEYENKEKDNTLKTYRKASIDYFAAQKEAHTMKWEPAKFDVVSTAQILSDSPINDDDDDTQFTKKLKNMGIKISKHISHAMSGNSPTPQPSDALSDNNEEEEMELKEDEEMDTVQRIDFKQKQRIARARRKSSATKQVFIEAQEEEPTKLIKYKHKNKVKKKKKKKKKKKAEFAVIDPAPKTQIKQQTQPQNEQEEEVIFQAKAGSGSILALDPLIKPNEVIYNDNIMNNDDEDGDISIPKIHKLLKETEKCDIMLRRRMRNELEDVHHETHEDIEYGEREYAAVGLSSINYGTCPDLMNRMSDLLGKYENLSDLKHVLFYKFRNKMGDKLSTVLTRMLCVFISVKIDIGGSCCNSVLSILGKFVLILDFKWVLLLCNTHKLYLILLTLSDLQFSQNSLSFNRIEIERVYNAQNYCLLIKLIDKYSSPFLLFKYLPLLCECGYSDLCYTLAVGYFPHCSPWFIRKCMYRYPLDHMNDDNNISEWNNIFKSYTSYLKLLFNIHPRTRCNGLLVTDLITLTLSLNAASDNLLFLNNDDKIPQIDSQNVYSDSLTSYILSIISDRSYYIEWSYLEIVCREYGFWKGLYKVYLHFEDIESLILLCCYCDYPQPILNLLSDLCLPKYWKKLLLSLKSINQRLNYQIVIQFMMRNIGPQNTLNCLKEINITNYNNIIYKEIVKQKQLQNKRSKLVNKIQNSLQKKNTLQNINHSSDEWAVMSSVNVRPPTQRAAKSLENNLTDLFTQLI